MTEISREAVNLAIVTFIVVLLFHLATEYVFKSKEKVHVALKALANAFLIAALAMLFHFNLENINKMEEVKKELASVKEISSGLSFYKPYETISKLDENNVFRKLLERQMEQIKVDLKEVENSVIVSPREEFLSTWETTISTFAQKEIRAINTISVADWSKFTPGAAISAHESAIKRGVSIKRLLIYDSDNAADIAANLNLAKKQQEQKVEIRFMASNVLESSSYYNTLMSKLSTIDFMVVDDECVFTAFTNDKNNIKSLRDGKILNDPTKVQLAMDYFDKLWSEAETMAVFSRNYPGTK
jgi:hypothetical protein